MLSTEKIKNAFAAICEEAEKLKKTQDADAIEKGLTQIILIAKHQSDIRGAAKGSCTSKGKESCKS